MANVRVMLDPGSAQYLGSAFPQYDKINGTNGPVPVLKFDAAATETAFWVIDPFGYASGNPVLDIEWAADTATSGVVRWEAQLAAITPETDTQDATTKAFATAQTVDDTHLGTTARRIMQATITITNLDSITNGDVLWIKLSRLGAHANDTMAGDAWLTQARFTYSNT